MNRCSFCEWIPIVPGRVWPLAGHARLGQNTVVGSMTILLAWLCWGACQEEVCLDPHFLCNLTPPRLNVELPRTMPLQNILQIAHVLRVPRTLRACTNLPFVTMTQVSTPYPCGTMNVSDTGHDCHTPPWRTLYAPSYHPPVRRRIAPGRGPRRRAVLHGVRRDPERHRAGLP